MLRTTLLIFITFLSAHAAQGQGEFNHWNFGWYSTLNFSDPDNIVAGTGPVYSDEGAASISDSEGNLLFSTDGTNVFDRNGDPMTGVTNLGGHWSSTQNAVIVPLPGDTEERFYYVFTVSAGVFGTEGNFGLKSVLIDLTLNQGLGDATDGPDLLVSGVIEKIHATMHDNGRDVWIVTHRSQTDEFIALPVSCEGIGEPIVSQTGVNISGNEWYDESPGMLKLSSNGEKIAMTWMTVQEFQAAIQSGSFDTETGEINIEFVHVESDEFEFSRGYGLAFSPNNDFLYWTRNHEGGSDLLRYDLNADDPFATELNIASASIHALMGLQIAPDGKIYVARSNDFAFLSRLENPNQADPELLTFMPEAVELVAQGALGLSNDWNYVPSEIAGDSVITLSLCQNTDSILDVSDYSAESYLWNNGDETPSLPVSEPGTYIVELFYPCSSFTLTYIVEDASPPVYNAPDEISLCEGKTVEVEVQTDEQITWYDGTESALKTFDSAGSYGFIVQTEFCQVEDEILLDELPKPVVRFSQTEYSICENQTLNLSPELNHANSYFWNDGSAGERLEIQREGTYSIEAFNECGSDYDSIEVVEDECFCSIYIPNSFTPNGDGLNDIFRVVTDCDYRRFNLRIYNRWGNLVWETFDLSDGWSGGENHYNENTIYSYLYTAELEKNGITFYREGKGQVVMIR